MSRVVICPVCERKVKAHYEKLDKLKIQKHYPIRGQWKSGYCDGSGRMV